MREISESLKGFGEFNSNDVKKAMEPITWSTNWIDDSVKPLREALILEKGGVNDTAQQDAVRTIFSFQGSRFPSEFTQLHSDCDLVRSDE